MTPAQQSAKAAEICHLAPVVPVLVIDDLAHAAPLARALVAGGLPVAEITFRTAASAGNSAGIAAPGRTSHIPHVRSDEAVTTLCPSALNRADQTAAA
mgnify:CR=1 FL=1